MTLELQLERKRDQSWDNRRHYLYYRKVHAYAQTFAPDAQSVLDVGSRDSEYLLDFDWVPQKTALDREKVYEHPEVESILADFMEHDFDRQFDLVLCLQVLEHLHDPESFAQRLLSLGRVVIISVPYRWPKVSTTTNHVQDPIDEKKVRLWMRKDPVYSCRVKDRSSKRWIGVYFSNGDTASLGTRLRLKLRELIDKNLVRQGRKA